MGRTLLLLHKTEGEARGQVLITMISYKCWWYNWLISYSLWLQTAEKETSNTDDLLDDIDVKDQFDITVNYTCKDSKSICNVSQGNNCTFNVSKCNNYTFNVS